MTKFITIALSIFEFLFYTVFMVLIGSITIENVTCKLLLHFTSLLIISILLYVIIKFILSKLQMKLKKYLYLIPLCNLIIGFIFPVFLIIIIPSEVLTTLAILLMASTIHYGLFINTSICIINFFFTKQG